MVSFVQADASGLALAVGIDLVGCAATPDSMNSVRVEMSKPEVIAVIGQPQSAAADRGVEFFVYSYCIEKCVAPPIYRHSAPYFVRLRGGRVDSFGRQGDFNSTMTPTTRVEVDRTDRISQDVKFQDSGDMYVELKKLKDLLDSGVPTQAEFDTKKKQYLQLINSRSAPHCRAADVRRSQDFPEEAHEVWS